MSWRAVRARLQRVKGLSWFRWTCMDGCCVCAMQEKRREVVHACLLALHVKEDRCLSRHSGWIDGGSPAAAV